VATVDYKPWMKRKFNRNRNFSRNDGVNWIGHRGVNTIAVIAVMVTTGFLWRPSLPAR
jgi:hypothetical protein